MYSKGTRTLSEDLGYGTSDEGMEKAQRIYDAVLTAYPVMAEWMHKVEKEAFRTGKVDNIFGRRRRLPELLLPEFEIKFFGDIDSKTKKYYNDIIINKLKKIKYKRDLYRAIQQLEQQYNVEIIDNEKIIADKKRNIVNFCIQGGAAVVTLRAMRNIATNKRLNELGCQLIMSIHDETLCSVPEEHAYECAKLIEQCSIDAGKGLPVPLSCDVEIARCWYGESLTFDENHNLIKMGEG